MQKKKIIGIMIASISILLVIFIIVLQVRKLSPIEHYEYPYSNRVLSPNNLIIPNEVLKRMTDKALIQATVDYPLLIDIYVVGTLEAGLTAFLEQCSAYKELMSRQSAQSSLLTDGVSILNELADDREVNAVKINALYDIITYHCNDVVIHHPLHE